MAAFKVGQRVRVVLRCPRCGREGTVVDSIGYGPLFNGDLRPAGEGDRYIVHVDGDSELDGRYYFAADLAPLTDPSADQFIERLKKLGSEPVNDAPKVGVTK